MFPRRMFRRYYSSLQQPSPQFLTVEKYYEEAKFLLGGIVAIAGSAVAMNQSATDTKFEGIYKDLAAHVKSCQAAISLQLNEKFTELMAEMAAGTQKTQAEMARLRSEVSDMKRIVEELTVKKSTKRW